MSKASWTLSILSASSNDLLHAKYHKFVSVEPNIGDWFDNNLFILRRWVVEVRVGIFTVIKMKISVLLSIRYQMSNRQTAQENCNILHKLRFLKRWAKLHNAHCHQSENWNKIALMICQIWITNIRICYVMAKFVAWLTLR